MDTETFRQHRLLNVLQSALLLAGMAGLLALLGWLLGGQDGVVWALVTAAALMLFSPGLSPAFTLRLYGARRLHPREAPELHRIVDLLAQRAGLARAPVLHYLPSQVMNAFALGGRDAAAVAVSDGLLRAMTLRELAGVLAHEVTHVRNSDTWVMGIADLFSRVTALFSTIGQVLLLVNLPLMVLYGEALNWLAVLLLIAAPTLSALMQLALSRTREYDADLGAAQLTGDPHGLASALQKMERYQGGFLERVLFPGRRLPEPSLLRTHPPTEERIRRLLELAPRRAPGPPPEPVPVAVHLPRVQRRPRRHLGGAWY